MYLRFFCPKKSKFAKKKTRGWTYDLPREEYMTRLRSMREAVSRIDFVTGPSFSSRI